jgi:hypothetical protein
LSQFFGAENRTYLTDIDLPGIDVLNLIKPAYQPDPWKAVLQTGTDSLGEVVQQGHPLIRTAAELATGRDFFTKRPLDEAYTPLDRAYQAVTGSREKLDPAIQALIKNIPGTQRIASLTGALLDQRLPVPARLAKATLNNLSGIKIQNVDPEYELLDAREKIARQLEPYNRTFTQAYIPEELLPYVPLESQRMNALDRELQRELRRRWEKG